MRRLHSIPGPRPSEGQATTEPVVRTSDGIEVSMSEKAKRFFGSVRQWLHKHHVALVFILAAAHVGLSYLHARDSGEAYLSSPLRGFHTCVLTQVSRVNPHGPQLASSPAESTDISLSRCDHYSLRY